MKSTIFYEGPSMIDGGPIVAIMSGLNGSSHNRKTGPMIQSWIIRSDISPNEAVKKKKDQSVCGSCKLRHNLGGACYVLPFEAPGTLFRAYQAGNLFRLSNLNKRQAKRLTWSFKTFAFRMGAYGDPGAVPFEAWQPILNELKPDPGWTGYTHQWMNSACSWLKPWCMASVETLDETELAQSLGWKTSRTSKDGMPLRNETLCLNQTRAKTECSECLLCNGQSKNIIGSVHGSRKERFI